MAASVDIVYRKDKVSEKGESPIHIRIIKNRKVRYMATGYKLDPKYWDENLHKVKRGYPNSVRLNHYLSELKNRYQEEVLKEETSNTTISARALKTKITGEKDADFISIAEQLANGYKAKQKIGTYNNVKSIIKKLKEIIGKEKLLLEEITPFFLSKYETQLKVKFNNKPNTVHKDLKFFRRVFSEAEILDIITADKNPFRKFKLHTEKTSRAFLTEHELNKIEELKLEKGSRLALHRDMFIFSAFAGGLRVSDLLLLRWKNFDGTHIIFKIQKTDSQLSTKLPNKAIAIVKRNKFKDARPNDFIFPIFANGIDVENATLVNRNISNATTYFNKNLKTIANMAGINKVISSHIARHSFATLALKKGISIDKVSKILGHQQIRETQIYAKIVNEELDKAMEVFN